MKRPILASLALLLAAPVMAQNNIPHDSLSSDSSAFGEQQVDEVTVTSRRVGQVRMRGIQNGSVIDRSELFKAACCNLGESFTTNPSVDVNYSDAATGAKQIKLLGLSGTYVQMLSETMPDFRGAAAPYSLGYVPGRWLQSIQVSKGSASVKNGYESMTGQINIEYLKPDDDQGITASLYGNTESKFEANADANIHLDSKLATNILLHFENNWAHHDGNGDGFQDQPNVRQYNLQNRWIWKGERYIFHGGLQLLNENRRGGQAMHHATAGDMPIYKIGIATNRYAAYMKHAFILNPEHGTNIALMSSFSMHQQDAAYGLKSYYVNEKNLYASLMLEHNFTPEHNLSTGLSLNHDYFGQLFNMENAAAARTRLNEKETVPGAYVQYTYNHHERFLAMAGLRIDHSNLYGTFFTPRFHIKWQPTDVLGFRLSAGKGYRAVHALAELNYLMASSRKINIGKLDQEEAWNFGGSTQLNIPLFSQTLKLNAEYYYTRFQNQAVVDFDSGPHAVTIDNLRGLSYSHVFQIDATYPLFRGMELTAAYRRNYVRETYGGLRMEKPLQSRYKALLTGSYKTPLGLWQFDATLQINGGGRMPAPYALADGTPSWGSSFGAYPQLSAQITRWFRHFSVYIGGENLTGKRQKHPVVGADNPWGSNFDTAMVWGPTMGAMAYIGIRLNWGRL